MRASPTPRRRIRAGSPRALLACAFLVLLGSAWGLSPREPDPQEPVQVRSHPVAGPVHWIEGRGGNLGVSAGEDGLLLIDDQFEDLAPQIQAELDKLSKAPLRFVVNTHWHGDHTGGNAVFGRKAPIVAQENVRERLQGKSAGRGPSEPTPPHALPVVTYLQSVSLHLNGEEVRVVHYPGAHTDGDSVVFFMRSNVVHMGDLFFSGRFPFVDLDSGGSVRGVERSVREILDVLADDVKIIPGHGPMSTKADLRRYRDMLADAIARVEKALAAGKSVEEMKEGNVLAGYEEWAWGFVGMERFVETLVRDLGRR
ncbi:MAG TPA: MBL fold metallo-hydrolase [Planctomycetota bacterium]|nr:MBL fold metallo-hydrolase [Planctomycetota bacterium]